MKLRFSGVHLCCSPVSYCSVLVQKCADVYSTQWRYIVHVINFNQGHALYSVKSY